MEKIREKILNLLNDNPNGLTSKQITSGVKENFRKISECIWYLIDSGQVQFSIDNKLTKC